MVMVDCNNAIWSLKGSLKYDINQWAKDVMSVRREGEVGHKEVAGNGDVYGVRRKFQMSYNSGKTFRGSFPGNCSYVKHNFKHNSS